MLQFIGLSIMDYHDMHVNALSEWIIGIYLQEFTNTEQEIVIPHETSRVRYWKCRVHC